LIQCAWTVYITNLDGTQLSGWASK
jgi:hypothetical protein